MPLEGLGVPDGFSGPDRSGGPGSSDGPDYPGDLRCPVGHNSHLPSFVSLFPKHLRRVKKIKERENLDQEKNWTVLAQRCF